MRKPRILFSIATIKLGITAAMLGILGFAVVPSASATPISFYNDAGDSTVQFTLGCGSTNGSCSGLLEALLTESGNYDSTGIKGYLFDVHPSDADERAFVNANTVGGDYFAGNGTKNESGNTTFSTSAAYFLIKIGGGQQDDEALLRNLSGGSLTLYFTQVTPSAGLSHWNAFGTAVAVPEPAALGMFGMGALLAGLFLGLRRRYG